MASAMCPAAIWARASVSAAWFGGGPCCALVTIAVTNTSATTVAVIVDMRTSYTRTVEGAIAMLRGAVRRRSSQPRSLSGLPLQILAKVDAPAGLGEPESQLSARACFVVQCGGRRAPPAAPSRRPPCGGCDERRADSLSPPLRDDIPAVEVPDAIGAAGVNDVVNRKLHEPDRAAVVERHQHLDRFV